MNAAKMILIIEIVCDMLIGVNMSSAGSQAFQAAKRIVVREGVS